jgi:uncharacterized protein (TIGR03435 family)
VQPFRISGTIPGRAGIAYRVDATMAPTATGDQIRRMLQALLVDRFKLVSHRVTKEFEGYNLSPVKSGRGIPETSEGDQAAPWPAALRKGAPAPNAWDGQIIEHTPEVGVGEIDDRRVTIVQLSEALEGMLGTAVWDQSGLTGNYYFALRYALESAPDDADALPLNAALQKSLGLKLEKHRGPVEMLVVDHIEKTPSEN